MASIQKRTSKSGVTTYRVGYMHDSGDGKGRRLQWTHGVTDPRGAVEMKGLFERLGPEVALATIRARLGRDGPNKLLLSEWFEKHLDALRAHATRGTIAGYRDEANRTWLPRLGALPLEAVTRENIVEWVAWQREQETHRSRRARERAAREGRPEPAVRYVAPKTIANAHGTLSTVLARAVEAGHIARNPARGVKLPTDQAQAQREKDIFTQAEWDTFYAAMHPHYRPLTLFLIATGCRIGEASAVQVRDIDLAGPEIDGVRLVAVHIRRAWKKGEGEADRYLGPPKSRRGNRTILLGPGMRDVLAPLIEGHDAQDLVFTAVQGGRVPAGRFNERYWTPAKSAAGITKELTPHSLRHTSASWDLMRGIPTQVVQHRLGHESIKTTSETYAHLLLDAQVSAAVVSSRALGLGAGQEVKSLES